MEPPMTARSLSDISCILEFAKLDAADLKPCVQCLYFSEHLENDMFKLIELDEPVLEALQHGNKVEIRGDPSEGAVLVTDSLTYDLKEAETSNSMLLLSQLTFGAELQKVADREIANKQVTSVVHNYYEIRPIKPRLKKLHMLLMNNPYRGPECEGDELDTGKNYTFRELQSCIQASDKELRAGLIKMNACDIKGEWRLLDFEFSGSVIYHIIQLCEERNWLSEGVNMEECCQILGELFPREVIEHLVQCYSREDDASAETGESRRIYFLSEDKICKHFAELCLRNSGQVNLNDFLRAWQESVPEGMKTSISQLEGMALMDKDSNPPVIWFYNVDELPEEISERFEALFEGKKKWSLDEITPYVKDLTDDKTDVGALLTKFARASLQQGIKMFSSRKTS